MIISPRTKIEVKAQAFRKGMPRVCIMHKGRVAKKQEVAISHLQNKQHKYILYGGAARGGKSWLGCEWLLWSCLAFPRTSWFIGRAVLKDLRQSTMRTFRKVSMKHGLTEGEDWKLNLQDNFILFSNGSIIDLIELKYKPEDKEFQRFGSKEYTGGWIEEAGDRVPFRAFDILKSRIGQNRNDEYGLLPKLFITCNPSRGWLKRIFYDPWKKGKLKPTHAFIQALFTDNPFRQSGTAATLSEIEDESDRKRLRDGDWETDFSPNRIVSDDAVADIWSNTFVPKAERAITADVARYGSDKFVILIWEGWRVIGYRVIKSCGLDEGLAYIESARLQFRVPASRVVFDADGGYGALGDFASAYGSNFVEFKAGEAPRKKEGRKEEYRNFGVQCAFLAAEKIEKREVYFECDIPETYRDEIEEEIVACAKKNPKESLTHKLDLVRKDDVKQQIGRSPDWWDCIKMRAALEFPPKFGLLASSLE